MNQTIIKVLGFLIGFFITLFLISYVNLQKKKLEKFELKTPTKEAYMNSQSTSKQPTEIKVLPYKSYRYMHISTYNDTSKISNSQGRWYENDLKTSSYEPKYNIYHYFTYDKTINLKPNTISKNGAYGADINTIQLNGPKSFYYANNYDTNELNEFSMVMSCKIKSFHSSNNIIFEMTGNTESLKRTDNGNEIITYVPSVINVNIQPTVTGNYNFILTVGNVEYKGNINNIDKSLIINTDLLMLGLIYTNSEITFLINKQTFKYPTTKNFTLTLGSRPVTINKEGRINMELYNFIYYKTILPVDEYLNIYTYNFYYLSGVNEVIRKSTEAITTVVENKKETELKCKEEAKEVEAKKITKRLDELENSIDKYLSHRNYYKDGDKYKKDKEDDNEIKPFNLDLAESLKKSSSYFHFLF